MKKFNLIEEPWIPCIMPDGSRKEFGIKDVLRKSHEIREIYSDSPLFIPTIHRILWAILYRIYTIKTISDWTVIWNGEHFDSKVINTYLDNNYDNFYLLHDQKPFYQNLDPPTKTESPVKKLEIQYSSGSNPLLFDHSYDKNDYHMSLSQAARALVQAQSFSFCGGNSKPFNFSDSPHIRDCHVIIMGNNLHETLMLNMVPYTMHRPFPVGQEDLPIWESSSVKTPDRNGNRPNGYIDYLTWQSRQIKLIADNTGSIAKHKITQNLKLAETGLLDPLKTYRVTDDGESALRINKDKALWRDYHALIELSRKCNHYKRPDALNWIARIYRESGRVNREYQVNVLGVCTEPGKATAYLWRNERLPVFVDLLDDFNFTDSIQKALMFAENTSFMFSKSQFKKVSDFSLISPLWTMARWFVLPKNIQDKNELREQLNNTKKKREAWIDQYSDSMFFWSELECHFKVFIKKLTKDKRNANEYWCDKVLCSAKQVFNAICLSAALNLRGRKAVAKSENVFNNQIRILENKYLDKE